MNVIKRMRPYRPKSGGIEQIFNYCHVPGLYETSGQPTKEQLELLAEKGYEVVINLAPNSILEGAVVQEASILKGLGVNYIHTPVDFNNPTNKAFQAFVKNIESNKMKRLWVHCAANMRVSAFTYRYRRDILHLGHDEIIGDMEVIWAPNKIWRTFLDLRS